MRKKYLILKMLTLLTVLFVVTGCGEKTEEKGELNFFNWTEYMPQSVLDAFTEEYGVSVNYTTYSSNEEMLAKIQSGQEGMYDLAIASDYMVSVMIDNGTIQSLDKSKLTNLGNLSEDFMDMEFDPGNQYSVPYMLSNALLAYNSDKVTDDITTVNDLFNPEYENSMVFLDDQRMVIGMVALSLGYSVNETDPTKLEAIKQRLFELKPFIKIFDSDTPKSSMIAGETAIGYMWNAEVVLSMQEVDTIVPVYPEEGMVLMFDNFVIPTGAKNKENAQLFIDFCMRPEIAKMISEEYPYVSPNDAAKALFSEAYLSNPVSNPPSEEIAKGQLLKNLGETAKIYDDIWTEFKNK
jgi:spermidine/putrescine transport system permease protein